MTQGKTWDRYAFVALGSNLGDSQEILKRAVSKLQGLSAEPVLRSSIWKTEPVDCPPGSPPFLNAVVAFIPGNPVPPTELLTTLKLIETEFGRRPKIVMNEPRPLDLDLIAFGGVLLQSETLTLPHPRAHVRRFVLAPLAEIAPDFVFPGQTKTVKRLLAELWSDEVIEKSGELDV
jgi:2-amino-4-hydroxy-6-hydroxymethyldihydropteridine diphosphokinase